MAKGVRPSRHHIAERCERTWQMWGSLYDRFMPTPIYSLRLAEETQQDLRKVAKMYGALNESEFVRSVLEAVSGRDLEKVKWLFGLLRVYAPEQLEFFPPVVPPPLAKRARLLRERGKGGRKRGRRT